MNFFLSAGLRLAYRIDGPADAPPIVFVNSLGTDYRMWDPQVEFFSRKLRIIRYDSRGHGSSAVPTEPYTVEQLGLDLLALLDTLDIERAHICGLSLGGMVALWCAATHPERVMSMICANSAARIGSTEMWNARIDAVSTGGMEAICAAALARFFGETFRQQQPAVTQRIREMLVATDPQGYIGACAALRVSDLHRLLGAIHVPTLIIAGTQDQATPPVQAQELHAAIPASQLVIMHEASHLSNVEQSDAFNRHVGDFLHIV